MFRNYLKVTFRGLARNKTYSFINIAGLAMGLACTILILLFVRDELSYDRHHEKSDRIVRLSREWRNQNFETSLHLGHLAPPFVPRLKEEFPDLIDEAVRLLNTRPLLSYGDQHFVENNFFIADSGYFGVFTQPAVMGDPTATLAKLNGLVINRSTAEKYFGEEDPLGKTLLFNSNIPLEVGAVVEDMPRNSHFHPDFWLSFLSLEALQGRDNLMSNYGSNNYSSYILLKEGVSREVLEARLPGFIDKLFLPSWNPSPEMAQYKPSDFNRLNVWPLTSIHLRSNLDSEIESNGDIRYVWIFGTVALFVLLIACINFMNLSTARASRRMKEVGLRKVVGANRAVLVRQFMGESILIAVISTLIAVLLVEAALPTMNNFLGKELALNYLSDLPALAGLVLIALLTGVVAGSYPALYLSSFEPAQVLKGQNVAGSYRSRFRSALVVAQFAVSTVLVACMGIVGAQMDFVQNRNLGFDKENIFSLPANARIRSEWVNLKNRLLQQPGIQAVSISSRVPSGRLLDSQDGTVEINGEMKELTARIADIHVDHDFFSAYKIPIVAGRDFDYRLASDSSSALILNESAIRSIGWASSEEAVGKKMTYGDEHDGTVIGVVKDFHFESLHQSIVPIVFIVNPGRFNQVSIRYSEENRASVMAYLEGEWTHYRPNLPFTPTFISDSFQSQYESERKLGTMFAGFSTFAIVIACLGLFGLASYVAERRKREIGIRKVLGASTGRIVKLLGGDFLKTVLIAIAVAVPISWYAMDRWLETFAYRIDIGFGPFLVAAVVSLSIAAVTVLYRTLRAAESNPVQSLRSE